jgi:hypothetical protein
MLHGILKFLMGISTLFVSLYFYEGGLLIFWLNIILKNMLFSPSKKEYPAFRLSCGIGCCPETVSRARYFSYSYYDL